MTNNQTTINSSISLEGVGIHTGKDVKLTFNPADPDTGYVFKRVDLDGHPLIEALSKYVVKKRFYEIGSYNGINDFRNYLKKNEIN